MKALVDFRMKKIFKEYLHKKGINIVNVKSVENTYEEISSHVDIFACKIKNKIICAKNISLSKNIDNIIYSESVTGKYENAVKYNVCITEKYAIGNFKYVDTLLKKIIEEENLELINVNQGYARCNILALNDTNYITSDIGIKNILEKKNFQVLYLPNEDIKLLDKSGKISKMKGFIGGSTCILDKEVILFGDVNKLKKGQAFKDFINNNGYTLKSFENEDIIDYGSVIFI